MRDGALEAFQLMRDDIVTEHDETIALMNKLRAEGKERTATFRQLLAQKMTLASMLERYKRYDLL
ncbi:hypothetical protein [Adlercreutzia murintestinalis]|uniref:hypothetical protein n=1 Tax=Adlercreutzia murintestinalis TaxID=2941325 RepID=UPI00203D3658|nr:hypothetical protein [Adlercreutzia murintestinalis]